MRFIITFYDNTTPVFLVAFYEFLQQSPVFKEDGSTEKSKINEVTEIIMPNNVAKQLAYALDSLANSESEH